jgi:hypothetical protein
LQKDNCLDQFFVPHHAPGTHTSLPAWYRPEAPLPGCERLPCPEHPHLRSWPARRTRAARWARLRYRQLPGRWRQPGCCHGGWPIPFLLWVLEGRRRRWAERWCQQDTDVSRVNHLGVCSPPQGAVLIRARGIGKGLAPIKKSLPVGKPSQSACACVTSPGHLPTAVISWITRSSARMRLITVRPAAELEGIMVEIDLSPADDKEKASRLGGPCSWCLCATTPGLSQPPFAP